MQKPCQDSYYTLFSSYPTLLDYHEEQAKNSRWIRCKVANLQVEPLGESSPLIGNLSAFAAGTSQEAVEDTAENLGLAMRLNGELYPVRMTAYKSLLDRAKIGGTALPKLSREVLAEVLNECPKLYSADALLLIRDEKISAVHSGDEVDYAASRIHTFRLRTVGRTLLPDRSQREREGLYARATGCVGDRRSRFAGVGQVFSGAQDDYRRGEWRNCWLWGHG